MWNWREKEFADQIITLGNIVLYCLFYLLYTIYGNYVIFCYHVGNVYSIISKPMWTKKENTQKPPMLVKKINTKTSNKKLEDFDKVMQKIQNKDNKTSKKKQESIQKDCKIIEVGNLQSVFDKQFPVMGIKEYLKKTAKWDKLISGKWWRPTKYYDKVVQDMRDFFNVSNPERILTEQSATSAWVMTFQKRVMWYIPTFDRFWLYIGVHRETLFNRSLAKNDDWTRKYPEFFDTYKACKQIEKNFIQQASALWLMNWKFAEFLLNVNHDMVEKTEDSEKAQKNIDEMKQNIKDLPYDQLQQRMQEMLLDWQKKS